MRRPTALVADDEPLLLAGLCHQLAQLWPELDIQVQASNGVEALRALTEHKPDVAFLDIRMPGLSGLDVAGAAQGTHVVFVTAYDEYALAAFDREALDYVLKPVTRARLQACVNRLRERVLAGWAAAGAMDALRQHLASRPALAASTGATDLAPAELLRWIRAGLGNDVTLVSVDEVLFFRASHKYTAVVTAEREHLIRLSIRDLMARLDAERFWQIHRAVLVNAGHIQRASRDASGRIQVWMRGHVEPLPVSRTMAHLFRQM